MATKTKRTKLTPERIAELQRQSRCMMAVALCFSFMVAVGILSFMLPKETVSRIENRTLQTMPQLSAQALLSGEFAEEFSLYYSDTFPAREWLIQVSSLLRSWRGVPGEGGVTLFPSVEVGAAADPAIAPVTETGGAAADGAESMESSGASASADAGSGGDGGDALGQDVLEASETQTPTTAAQAPEEESAAKSAEDGAYDPNAARPDVPKPKDMEGEVRGAIVVVGDQALNVFGFDSSAFDRYATIINDFAARYEGRVQTNALIIPMSVEFYLPTRYADLSSDQFEAMHYAYDQMDERVNRIWAYDTLATHADQYIFFRTDHHWTPLGAYYAWREFAAANDIEPVPLIEHESETLPGFLGSLYNLIGGNESMRKHPDTVVCYRPTVDYEYVGYYSSEMLYPVSMKFAWSAEEIWDTNYYIACAGGDLPYAKITTSNKNGRKLLVFKESFANAMLPFFADAYEEVHVVDFRYFTGDVDKLIRDNGINEAVFINATGTAGAGVQMSRMEYMFSFSGTTPEAPAAAEGADAEGSMDGGAADGGADGGAVADGGAGTGTGTGTGSPEGEGAGTAPAPAPSPEPEPEPEGAQPAPEYPPLVTGH